MELVGVIGSGYLVRQMVILKCPSKFELDISLDRMVECLVGRLQRDIIGA